MPNFSAHEFDLADDSPAPHVTEVFYAQLAKRFPDLEVCEAMILEQRGLSVKQALELLATPIEKTRLRLAALNFLLPKNRAPWENLRPNTLYRRVWTNVSLAVHFKPDGTYKACLVTERLQATPALLCPNDANFIHGDGSDPEVAWQRLLRGDVSCRWMSTTVRDAYLQEVV